MKVLIAPTIVCPICKIVFDWEWIEGVPTVSHPKQLGTEYCENFGKSCEAPLVEIAEKELVNG